MLSDRGRGSEEIQTCGAHLTARATVAAGSLAVYKVKLYRPVAGEPDAYPQRTPALTRPIRWELIAQQYHQPAVPALELDRLQVGEAGGRLTETRR
ncbi:hypothetical protein AB0G20_21885 [Streptomyces sp. NPDC024017]|uniref:hypothetical protein n=1 Tax=Streptomyces sp. NPDC024017 TaxID=3154326 RepID=UPI003401E915